MPIYEYRCEACGEVFEDMVLSGQSEPDICPKCGSPQVSRLISNTSFQLKGGGWYVTDYGKGTSPSGSTSSSTSSDASDSSGTAGSADSGAGGSDAGTSDADAG